MRLFELWSSCTERLWSLCPLRCLKPVLNSLLQLPAHPALGRGLDEAVSRAATRLNNFVLQCEKKIFFVVFVSFTLFFQKV